VFVAQFLQIIGNHFDSKLLPVEFQFNICSIKLKISKRKLVRSNNPAGIHDANHLTGGVLFLLKFSLSVVEYDIVYDFHHILIK
jgi:hypothetical protein